MCTHKTYVNEWIVKKKFPTNLETNNQGMNIFALRLLPTSTLLKQLTWT